MRSQADLDFNIKDLTRARTLTTELAEFSARAGHDLLGPLNQASALLALFVQGRSVQSGLVQSGFVQSNDSEADAEARTLLELLQASAARMQGVVNGVQPYLDIAATAPDFEEVDMNTAVASAQLRLDKAIGESAAVIASEPLPAVSGVGDQMTMLFEILIANSIRFRREQDAPRIRISAERAAPYRVAGNWLFRVEDNGIGIDTQYREIVFRPFRRLHGKEYAGAGMGLATAKLIVGLHGGDIWIEPVGSDAPCGTAVLFTVPVSA
jgi:light-regulated signal transduction histidine kinase (bacteriophytochrome)